MSEDYKKVHPTEEDDPARVKFLEELSQRKNREPFTYKEVLSTPASCFEPKPKGRRKTK